MDSKTYIKYALQASLAGSSLPFYPCASTVLCRDISVKPNNLKIQVNEGCEIFLVTAKNQNKRGYKMGCFGLYDQ